MSEQEYDRVGNIHNSERWSEEEDSIIKKYRRDINLILYRLDGRTIHSVKARARRLSVKLKVSKTTAAWTPEEEAILQENEDTSLRHLTELLPAKNSKHIKDKMEELGLQRCGPSTNWTRAEDEILRKHHKDLTAKEFSTSLLPKRTEHGILYRCMKLGLRKMNEVVYDSEGYTICSICHVKKHRIEMAPECSFCKKCRSQKARHIINLRKDQGVCITCGEAPPVEGSRMCRPCQKVKSRAVSIKRKERKQQGINYLGGRCLMCGLESDIVDVFDFHHLDEKKDKEISSILKQSWETVREELDNCVVFCADCHILWHYFRGNRDSKNWTAAEEDKLKAIWGALTKEELEIIFPERTWKSIHERAKKLCLNGTNKSEGLERKDSRETGTGSAFDVEENETHQVKRAADAH